MSQLVGRCAFHRGGVTVIQEVCSSKGGVASIRKVYQLIDRWYWQIEYTRISMKSLADS